MTVGPNSTGRSRLVGIILLVATFLAGGFSGAAIERRAGTNPPAQETEQRAQPTERTPAGRTHASQRRLVDQLDLTAEQRVTIDSILQDGREKLDAFWKETGPGYRELVDSTRARVREILTAEQQIRYDELRAERRRRRKKNIEGRSTRPDSGSTSPEATGASSPRVDQR